MRLWRSSRITPVLIIHLRPIMNGVPWISLNIKPRDLFEKHGVPVLAGAVATTPQEAEVAARAIGGKVVVKKLK